MGRKNSRVRHKFIRAAPKASARTPTRAGSCTCGYYVRDDVNHCPSCHHTFRALRIFIKHKCPDLRTAR